MIKVMKFGGSSVADAPNMDKVIGIVGESLQGDEKVVVIVSALGGMTDDLIKLANLAHSKDSRYKILFEEICKRHDQVVEGLISKENQLKVLSEIGKKYDELKSSIENIFYASSSEKIPLSFLDTVMSFGEQLSSYILSEGIRSKGIPCKFVDARTLIKTDDSFGTANVDIESSYTLISEKLKNENIVSVLGGFIGSTKMGETTTLSRGGSDYTAALVGAALDASQIEIWTDVDGLMTADPKKMKDALLIPEISYSLAEEMAYAGAKVIHPKTIQPALRKGIPIFIKNTFNPKGNGTKIN